MINILKIYPRKTPTIAPDAEMIKVSDNSKFLIRLFLNPRAKYVLTWLFLESKNIETASDSRIMHDTIIKIARLRNSVLKSTPSTAALVLFLLKSEIANPVFRGSSDPDSFVNISSGSSVPGNLSAVTGPKLLPHSFLPVS